MKKILLSFTLACFGLASNAQVILTQDFESVTAPALPAGWVLDTATPGPVSHVAWFTSSAAGTNWGTLTGKYNIPTSSQYVVVDDAANPGQLHDTLKSPVFSLVGKTTPWLNFDCFFYGATQTSTSITEHAYVLGSINGGTTWSVIDSVLPYAWNGAVWTRQHINLTTTLSGANCMIAFTYSDGGGAILGVALDNIEVKNLNTSEAGLLSLNYNSIANGISANGTPLSFTVQNDGITLTSLDAYYTINGGAQVTQSFTGLSLAPYATQTLTFTTAMSGAITGTNALRVGATQANGIANVNKDSVLKSSFLLASATTTREGLVEEFSSSTCAPCKAFNFSYDPLCLTLNADVIGSNFNVIHYQMNWPSPGTDKSYNNDGLTRRTFYGCNSIPEHWVNGVMSNVGWTSPFSTTNTTDFTNEANSSHADMSFIDITATYNVDTFKKKVGVILTVTPHFTKTGTFHVYTALCDKHYTNTTNTTGQLDYYNVMRKMLPSANGHAVTSWTDGVSQTFADTAISYVNDNYYIGASSYPLQMSSDFWSNPLLGSEMIAFVQEDASHSIMQSFVAIPTNTTTINGVSTISNVTGISIYPNPAKDEATLSFYLGKSGNVHVKLVDYTGRLIADVMNDNRSEGAQKVTIPTTNVAPGNYIVLIEANGGTNAQRITVEK